MCKRLLLFLLLSGCVTVEPPHPTEQSPVVACRISCSWGMPVHHLCRGGSRWFTSATLIGEHVSRSVDGVIIQNLYITKEGDYPKDDFVLMSCEAYKREEINARDPKLRGERPVEDIYGNPIQPDGRNH